MPNEYITQETIWEDAKDLIRPIHVHEHKTGPNWLTTWYGRPLIYKGKGEYLIFHRCDYCRTEEYPVMDDFDGWMCSRCGAPV